MPVQLQPFPARDEEFVRNVTDAFASVSAEVSDDEELRAMVERRLRATYPNAVVRMQDELARLGGGAGTMYAYRDGHVGVEEDGFAFEAPGTVMEAGSS
ncbi:MAG TPA: hypothetical protein VFU17_02380 [Candidatus Limnocylindrales bacterium]|nr:hypothetical protein [Candidatus Limnocylindrales bacterium]